MRSQGRATIIDVARSADVSVATVSKVLNGRYGVAVATAERVRAVIEQLGYESSLVARSLRSHRTNVIGVLLAEFEPFSTELLKGLSKAIGGSGYELLAYSGGGRAGGNVGWERRYLSRLSGTLIDGAILVTPTVIDDEYRIPVVAVDPHTGPSALPTVDSDNLAGAVLATEHLLGLGHRRIGFLAGRPDLESARLREEGYRSTLAAAGLPVDPDLIRVGWYREESADQPARELLTMADRPTAIFAANDLSALKTMEVARSLGLSIPADLSVVGFDNVPEAALSTPALTTISQPIQQMGVEAMRLLIALVNGDEVADTHRRLPTELISRGSCSAP
ncbi:LacI family DNA-binding transcriptional regulator [Pengzhenrongella sicca]|uniref:LacI family DNA-binding transcriptional regulator n=1 Tax=Pengzhenrongella sicca TaxID=2819238 RepID=A0A8A4ZDS0_9MICO|nr:LacI family DNA-binding transcriptional regulator [Pengzhenrongella sicca]QTE28696.1 LacI family DNA-binding transcriptional regulator [Pengzhenrongella sicca]